MYKRESFIKNFDIVIVGAGIIGFTIAYTILLKRNDLSVCIIEKENKTGAHASGRNSGVLHSGIYYPSNSLKAKMCVNGSNMMQSYCRENNIFVNKMGKVILPTKESDVSQLSLLYRRAVSNGANVEMIDKVQLKEIEPEANSKFGCALYSQDTSVIDPVEVLSHLEKDIIKLGGCIDYNAELVSGDIGNSTLRTKNGGVYKYTLLINSGGQYADKIAHIFNVGYDYELLPFRGSYYKLSEKSGLNINGLIYPVPDLNVPFLGVHTVKSLSGSIYFGPSAVPAFGREHYKGLEGINFLDVASISYYLSLFYISNRQGFRVYANCEANRVFKSRFCAAVKKLVPNLNDSYMNKAEKVGIRAQLINKKKLSIEMDFIIEKNDNTIHILNAVSPAFTSSFAIANYIVDSVIN